MTETSDKCCCTPPPDGGDNDATLLLSEDFAGERKTNEDLTFYSGTLGAYLLEGMRPYTTHEGLTCGHYFAQEGTNEQTPWMVSVETDTAPDVVGAETFSEFCVEWKEFFKSPYPWPHGQKMFRCGYESGRNPSSKKSFELACLDNNRNLQLAHYIGMWGNDDHGSIEWYENTGADHPMDEWVTWRTWVKLNTPGQSDGFVRMMKNGSPLVTAEDLNLRGTDPLGFNWLWWGGNYSTSGGAANLPTDGDRYITGLRWWSTEPAE
jgi:hypothetical protein